MTHRTLFSLFLQSFLPVKQFSLFRADDNLHSCISIGRTCFGSFENLQHLATNQKDSCLSVLYIGELASARIPEKQTKALEDVLHPEIIYKA